MMQILHSLSPIDLNPQKPHRYRPPELHHSMGRGLYPLGT